MNPQKTSVGVFRLSGLIPSLMAILLASGLRPVPSGSAGTGMAWDWNWLDDDNFYRYIQAAAQAVKDIPFSRRTWRDVQVQAFEFADAARKPYFADTLIEGFPGNYKFPPEAPDRELFTVQKDGRLDRQDLLHARLGQRQSRQAPAKSFQVRHPHRAPSSASGSARWPWPPAG